MTPVAWLKIMTMNSNLNRLAGEKDPTYLHSWPSHVLPIRLTPTIVNPDRKNWQKKLHYKYLYPLNAFLAVGMQYIQRSLIARCTLTLNLIARLNVSYLPGPTQLWRGTV